MNRQQTSASCCIAFPQHTPDSSDITLSPELAKIAHNANASEPQQIPSFQRSSSVIPRFAASSKKRLISCKSQLQLEIASLIFSLVALSAFFTSSQSSIAAIV